MKKFWRGFRKLNYHDEEKMRVREQLLEKLKRIIHEGRHEAEQEYVDFIKQLMPNLPKEELQRKNQAVSRRCFGRASARSRISLERFAASLNSSAVIVSAAESMSSPTLSKSFSSADFARAGFLVAYAGAFRSPTLALTYSLAYPVNPRRKVTKVTRIVRSR